MSHEIEVDSIQLMRALAKMASMDEAGIRRMVLVLDVNDAPRLYVDSFLRHEKGQSLDLPQVPLEVEVDKPYHVEVAGGMIESTSIQNEEYRTHVPK